jgi:hypothetical protein
VVTVQDPSGYPADNRRHVLLGAQPGARLLLAGSGAPSSGFYLSRALTAAQTEVEFDIEHRDAAAIASTAAGDLAERSAIVLLSTRNLDRRGRTAIQEFVHAGGGLIAAASADVNGDVLASVFGWSSLAHGEQVGEVGNLAPIDLRHPVFRSFGGLAANIGQARFTRAWKVTDTGWDVLARFGNGTPALLERREGQGRVLLFASDLDRRWNDLPVTAAFVPLVVELVRHAAGTTIRPREYTTADVPAGVPAVPGVHDVDGRRVVVNVDPRESAPDALGEREFAAMLRSGPEARPQRARRAHEAEARQGLWRYGLMLMLLVLAAESVVGRR